MFSAGPLTSRRITARFRTLVFLAVVLSVGVVLLAGPLSAQTFKNPTLIATATDPMSISKADLNGDNKIDLIYLDGGSGSNFLHILLGNGDGSFQRGQNIPLPFGFDGVVTIADVNKDGKLDLILGGGGLLGQAQVGVLLGNGDGTFQPLIISTFSITGDADSDVRAVIGVADLNGDGAVDLAMSDALNSAVYVLLGNNSGSFTLKTTLFNGSTPANVFTADLNGDHNIDLVVQGVLGADATVYLGKGDGTFQAGVRYTGPHNIGSLILRDMDGDGHLDMVVTGFNNTIDILHGNPDGTFASTSEGGTANGGPAPLLLAVTDLNSDGIVDLAVATENGICILLGTGNLAYLPPVPYSGSPNPFSAVMADFNGDGFQDFAELAPGGIALIFGAPGGTLQSADLYDLGEEVIDVAVADFTGDHIPDVAVNTSQATPIILTGTGGGKFTVPRMPAPPANQAAGIEMFTGDFNGDGKADIMLTHSSPDPSVTVFFGNGNGTFSAPVAPTISGNPTFGVATIGDFNRDGLTDIAVLDAQSLDVLLGQRNNTFNVQTNSFPELASGNAAAAGDFNRDGNPDLVIAQDSANVLLTLLGNGDGNFSLGHQLPATILPLALGVADLDGDGNPDIIALEGFINIIQIYYGNGDGTFQAPVTLSLQRQYTAMQIADMDHDGKPDLVLTDNKLIAIIRNLGNRNFAGEQHILAGAVGTFVAQDVNGDGLPDLVVANGATGTGIGPTTITVLLNQSVEKAVGGQLSASPEPSPFAQPFMISLSVTPQGTNPPAPTGTVSFSVDDVPLATVPVTSLSLSVTDSNSASLPVGVHALEAVYSGDKNYLAATFTGQHEVVPIVFPTTTTLSATPSTAQASQTVRFTATVTSPGQNANAPNPLTGTVAFRDGSTNLGTATVGANGVALFDTALLSQGSHSITAFYLGYTAQFQQTASFATSNSSPIAITITAQKTTVSLTGQPASVAAGSVVSLTAAVSSAFGTPTGAVTFLDGSTSLSALPLDATGTAVLGATFSSSGTHSLTASYQANSTFAAAVSSPVTITVTAAQPAAQSSTQLAAVPDSQTPDQVVLTANVSGHSSVPMGTVAFMDGAATIGKVVLNGQGSAAYSVVLSSPGLHYLTAVYGGDSKHSPSASSPVLEHAPLNSPDFSLNLALGSLTLSQGASATTLATVTSINGFGSAVSISCSAASLAIECQASGSSLPKGQGSSPIVIRAVHNHAGAPTVARPAAFPGPGLLGIIALLAAASWFFLVPAARRRRLACASMCVAFALLAAGCAAPFPVSRNFTPAGTYVLTVQASSLPVNSAAAVVHRAQLQVQVVARRFELNSE